MNYLFSEYSWIRYCFNIDKNINLFWQAFIGNRLSKKNETFPTDFADDWMIGVAADESMYLGWNSSVLLKKTKSYE